MKIVINRSGRPLQIPEIRKEIPWDGKRYLLEDILVSRYRGFLEIVEEEKDKEINILKKEIQENKNKIDLFNKENLNLRILLNNFKQNINIPKIDFLYPFHFNDNQNEAIQRLKHSIKSIINQNVNVCICNTSKKCILKNIKNLGKIKYYHEPLNLEMYCKPKTINLGVEKLVNTDYFILSDIDLFYHPDFIKSIGIFWVNNNNPIRVVFNNNNLGVDIFPTTIEECKKIFLNSIDNNRTRNGIAPGNGLIHRKSFDDILGFDERYIGYGPEDADFNYRIKKICKYVEIDLDEFNTYHFYHKNKNCNTFYFENNCILYNFIKREDKKQNFSIIKSGQLIIPKEENIKEIFI